MEDNNKEVLQEKQEVPEIPNQEREEKKKKKVFKWVAIGVVIFLAIFLIPSLIVTRDDDSVINISYDDGEYHEYDDIDFNGYSFEDKTVFYSDDYDIEVSYIYPYRWKSSEVDMIYQVNLCFLGDEDNDKYALNVDEFIINDEYTLDATCENYFDVYYGVYFCGSDYNNIILDNEINTSNSVTISFNVELIDADTNEVLETKEVVITTNDATLL